MSALLNLGERCRSALSLARDNPVLLKDAGLLLRRRVAAAAWAVVAIGLLLLAGGSYLASAQDHLRQWGTLSPPGGEMLIALTGVLLVAVTFLLPALASTTIAAERESGTLPLLLVSGLSPERLIVGKVGALFTAAAPFLALTLPLFALCSLFLGIDVGDVALAAAGVFVHALTLCCVGVWASAVSERMRSAALVAMTAAAVPSLLGALPVFISIVSVAEDRDRLLVVGVVGTVIELLIAVAAVVGAWTVLVARSAQRWRPGRWLLVTATVGVPVVAAGCLLLSGNTDTDAAAGVTLQVVALVFGAVVFAPIITGRRPHTPTPAKAALTALVLAVIGLSIGSLGWTERMQNDVDAADVSAVFAVLAAVAGVAAFAGRWLKTPLVAFFGTAAVFIALFAIPGVLDEFLHGRPPLAFLNLAYVVDRSSVSVVPTVVFYGALALITFVCARGPRRA